MGIGTSKYLGYTRYVPLIARVTETQRRALEDPGLAMAH